MAVKSRVAAATVDLGDQKQLIADVVVENEELYDLTYNTMIAAFTKPLSPQELDDVIARIDMQALASMVLTDPETATELLRAAREGR